MWLMPLPLRVDLSQLQLPSVANLLTPIVPGVVLSAGALYFQPVLVERYFSLGSVGYGVKVTTAALSAYAAGLALSVFTEICLGLLAAIFVNTVLRIGAIRITAGAWRSSAFRKLAANVLGPLAPPDEQPMSDCEYDLELKKCDLGVPQLEAVSRKVTVWKEKTRRQSIDWEWQRWCQVLAMY
jgi:hypothetical protein